MVSRNVIAWRSKSDLARKFLDPPRIRTCASFDFTHELFWNSWTFLKLMKNKLIDNSYILNQINTQNPSSIINIQKTKDNKSFLWCIPALLYKVDTSCDRVSNCRQLFAELIKGKEIWS